MLDDFYEKVSNGATSVRFGDVELHILTQQTDVNAFSLSENLFFMAKSLPYITGYKDISDRLKVKDLLEVGIYKGGSVVFFDNTFDLNQLTAIDISQDRLPDLDKYVDKRANSKRISLHYGIDQGDRATLRELINKDFPKGIDMVIDDASHFYGPSKATFETVFPRLRPGGVYVVEDWSWSHSQPSDGGDNEDATRLLHEIIALHASSSGMAKSIDLRPGFFSVTRGSTPIPDDFKLEDYALKHRVGALKNEAPIAESAALQTAQPALTPLRALKNLVRSLIGRS